MAQFLSQTERLTLNELDRLIDWHNEHGKPLNHITLNQTQYDRVKRIAKKAQNSNVFDEVGVVDITEQSYKGIAFELPRQTRAKYKKKATVDMF